MARPAADSYELSDAEKRDLIRLIEQGKPLPEKYRFLLFADTRHAPVVMVSADATGPQVQRLLDLGAHAYLTKPFRISVLLQAVDDALALSR